MVQERPPTNLEYALLGLLHQGPQSGYDLRKVFLTTALGNYSSSPGAIYPALRRLETRRLIHGEIDDTKALRPRKLFSPSGTGRAAFRDWLRADVESDAVVRRFDELMLRFAFHWVLDDQRASRDFLAALARQIALYVEELETQRRDFPPQTPIQPRLALEAGIAQYRAAAAWAQNALEHFKKET